jgi:hypothetical protein
VGQASVSDTYIVFKQNEAYINGDLDHMPLLTSRVRVYLLVALQVGALIGLVLLILNLALWSEWWRYQRVGVPIPVIVTERGRTGDDYWATFQLTLDGQSHTVTHRVSERHYYNLQSNMTGRYLPARPYSARLETTLNAPTQDTFVALMWNIIFVPTLLSVLNTAYCEQRLSRYGEQVVGTVIRVEQWRDMEREYVCINYRFISPQSHEVITATNVVPLMRPHPPRTGEAVTVQFLSDDVYRLL